MAIIIGILVAAGLIIWLFSGGRVMKMHVAADMKECTGAHGPSKCLVVNDSIFYDYIEGFEYEPGNEYILLVLRTRRVGMVMDVGIFKYDLITVLNENSESTSSSYNE